MIFAAFGKKITKSNILSSINFINIADEIFTATLSKKDIERLNITNYFAVHKENGLITFINLNFKVTHGSIVYCNSDYLEGLFHFLKNTNVKNIILISSQSDREISKDLFNKKPRNIINWYSTNVNFQSKNLIPIPLGIAPYRNSKSVIFDDFLVLDKNKNKTKLLYSNFNLNTNYFHRKNATYSIHSQGFEVNQPFSSYDEYLAKVSRCEYLLAPWGNGIDTHRFWEALYCETIPVTKSHYIYKSFINIPKVLLNKYNEISLIKNLDFKSSDVNYEITMDFWLKKIKRNYSEFDVNSKYYHLNDVDLNKTIKEFNSFDNSRKRKKKLYTVIRKLDKKLNILRKI